jgi:esterase/lipase superfamily enzyme
MRERGLTWAVMVFAVVAAMLAFYAFRQQGRLAAPPVAVEPGQPGAGRPAGEPDAPTLPAPAGDVPAPPPAAPPPAPAEDAPTAALPPAPAEDAPTAALPPAPEVPAGDVPLPPDAPVPPPTAESPKSEDEADKDDVDLLSDDEPREEVKKDFGPEPDRQPGDDVNKGPVAVAPARPENDIIVYYGTNRRPTADEPEPGRLDAFYGNARDDSTLLHYGTCAVHIPERHKRGSGVLERPWSILGIQIESEDPALHFTLKSLQVLTVEPFFARLRSSVSESKEKEAFVFIHGFNTRFADAAYRTAQIAYDLDFDGPALLFSWPTWGDLSGYIHDIDEAENAQEALAEFLRGVATRSGARRIHLIAHSMGNRALNAGLDRLSHEVPSGSSLFDQVVLAAPDVDAIAFRRVLPLLAGYSHRVTLYASKNDWALVASRKAHRGGTRIGEDITLVAAFQGIEGVDSTGIDDDYFSLGHSTFADEPHLLRDIREVLAGRAPDDRKLHRIAPPGYWGFAPGTDPPPPWPRWQVGGTLGGIASAIIAGTLGVRVARRRRIRSATPPDPVGDGIG